MIFVTGATGLVGSAMCQLLISKGLTVRALRRVSSDISHLGDYAHQIDWVLGDLDNFQELVEALDQVHTVIHCAALVSFSKKRRRELFQTNVEGTKNLLHFCAKKGDINFVYVSSVAAITGKKSPIMHEDMLWEASQAASSYAKSKFLAELEVWRAGAEGLNVAIVNPSVILGPGNWNRSSTQLFKYVWEQRSFYVDGKVNFVDVRTVAHAIWEIIDQKKFGRRYIINAGQTTYLNLFQQMAKQWDKKPPYRRAGNRIAYFVYLFDQLRLLFTKAEPLITKETITITKSDGYYDPKRSIDELGLSYYSLEDTVRWACQQLLIKHDPSKVDVAHDM